MKKHINDGDAVFRGVVGRIAGEYDQSRQQIADACGFSEPHLRRILDNPNSARLCDIRALDAVYDLTEEELRDIVRGRPCGNTNRTRNKMEL